LILHFALHVLHFALHLFRSRWLHMPQQTDLEKDPFLVLLTDALRAGPGSPEWHDAVAKLKLSGENVDEYRLLIEAREALESGKDYRSVRAGAGFTHKLLNNLEAEQKAERRPFPLTGFISVLAALVIAAVIGVGIYELYPRGNANPAVRSNIDELASTYLATTVLSASFDSGIPAGWRKIGSLPVEADKGLSAAKASVPQGGYIGGGLVLSDPLPADQTFSVSVTLQIHGTGEALIPQIFVANSPDFSSDRGTASQELVWELDGLEQRVVVGGRVEKQAKIPNRTQTLAVRLILNKDLAIVDSDSARLWSGLHTLGEQPRYVGVRFIRTDGKSDAEISIQSVHVQKR
jgi:hypothetical protein